MSNGTRVMIDPEAEATWGYLVKIWATGDRKYLAQMDPPHTEIDINELRPPRDMADLKRQLRKLEIDAFVHIPETTVGVAIVQYSANVLALRLPPKELIEASEATLGQGTSRYRIGSFYSILMSPNPLSPEEKLKMHACRIGEYSVNSCA